MQFLPANDDLPDYAELGYLFDWIRQQQKLKDESIKKHIKLQKKVNKLTKKNKVIKRK